MHSSGLILETHRARSVRAADDSIEAAALRYRPKPVRVHRLAAHTRCRRSSSRGRDHCVDSDRNDHCDARADSETSMIGTNPQIADRILHDRGRDTGAAERVGIVAAVGKCVTCAAPGVDACESAPPKVPIQTLPRWSRNRHMTPSAGSGADRQRYGGTPLPGGSKDRVGRVQFDLVPTQRTPAGSYCSDGIRSSLRGISPLSLVMALASCAAGVDLYQTRARSCPLQDLPVRRRRTSSPACREMTGSGSALRARCVDPSGLRTASTRVRPTSRRRDPDRAT